MEEVIVIGSGPAGLTAALYAARANLSPLIFTGKEIGGQMSISNEIENFPGFPEGLTGPELVDLMKRQAERFGARFEVDEVSEVKLDRHPFWLKTRSGEHEAKALIIACGASPRRLGVPGEQEFIGRGVSYCATCDGLFFTGKEIVVVGGGDSAMQEGLFLTRFASKVHIVHRRDKLRASPIMQDRVRSHEKIRFIWNSVVIEILGDNAVNAVRLRNVKTGEESILPTEGVFVYIGHIPNTELFKSKLEMNAEGYIVADKRQRTSVPGVFAAGDVQDWIFQQAITSAGTGAAAAIEAARFIEELEHRGYPPA
jgi:thioredoxin reductase (NADPH)